MPPMNASYVLKMDFSYRLYLNMSLFTAGFGSSLDLTFFVAIEACLHTWALLIHPSLKVCMKEEERMYIVAFLLQLLLT